MLYIRVIRTNCVLHCGKRTTIDHSDDDNNSLYSGIVSVRSIGADDVCYYQWYPTFRLRSKAS